MTQAYDLDHRPITDEEGALLAGRLGSCKVAETYVPTGGTGTLVSTIFLVFDHNHGGDGPPVLYETMTFEGVVGGYQWRWTDKAAALAGHERVVTAIRESWVTTSERSTLEVLLRRVRARLAAITEGE